MKKLIIVNGTMGVGKTATCNQLLAMLHPGVFLDGDWCWNMQPFIANDETKRMVLKNICFLLNNFLACSEYEYVIFCWVMHREKIMAEVLNSLSLERVELHKFTLSITETELTKRLLVDIKNKKRNPDCWSESRKD